MRRPPVTRLERNGLLLLTSQAIVAGSGLVFWAVVARLYTSSEVGLAVALINAAGLVAQAAVMGCNQAIVRFGTSLKPFERLLSTGLVMVLLSASVIGFLAVIVQHFRGGSPGEGMTWVVPVFLFACVMMPVNLVFDAAMLVRNAVALNTVGYLIGSIARIALVVLLVQLGYLGVLLAHALSYFTTGLISAVHLARAGAYRPFAGVDLRTGRRLATFAASSHIAGLAWTAPTMLYPIIVMTVLGSASGAHLYMALSMASLLQMVALSASQSLFSEASVEPERAVPLARRSLRVSLSVTAVAGLVLVVAGDVILSAFGREYAAEGWLVLALLVPSQLIACVNLAANSIAKVRGELTGLLVRNLVGAGVSLSVTTAMLGQVGNVAVAWGVFAGQMVMVLANTNFVLQVLGRGRPPAKPPRAEDRRAPDQAHRATGSTRARRRHRNGPRRYRNVDSASKRWEL